MSVEVLQQVIYDQSLDAAHHLRVITRVDSPASYTGHHPMIDGWLIEPETRSKQLSALVLSTRPKKLPKTPKKTLVGSLLGGKNGEQRSYVDPGPAPYTVHLTATRFDPSGQAEDMGVWSFSGLLRSGRHFHIRTDAILDLIKGSDGTPYTIVLDVRLRSKRNRKLEHLNTAQHSLEVGDSSYELVSREILSLFSNYFEVLFYGAFSEAESTGPIKIHPMHNEDPAEFERTMVMMLEYAMYGTLSKVTMANVTLLLDALLRFGFYECVNRRIEQHVIKICQSTNVMGIWEDALQLSDMYRLNRIPDPVIRVYSTDFSFPTLVQRTRGRFSGPIVERIFLAYKSNKENEHFDNICHIYMRFFEGTCIMQLNRSKLPRTITRLVKMFSPDNGDMPHFYWDNKDRLVSTEFSPRSLHHADEAAGKDSVPSDAWALILRKMDDGRYKLFLTKSRPSGTYLGFVTKGKRYVRPGQRSEACGLHSFSA